MTLAPGTRLGPYEIMIPIGAGGMGEVYRARDTTLGRDVAVKVLPAAFTKDHDRVARFRREAQVLATFNHPNIASIHGFEETEEGVALALELVEGEDLQQRLRRGPIPKEEARAIAKQIAEGLEAAHEKGIMHRDLKPANVKVTPEGQVKVLDFGLAKAFDTEADAMSGSNDVSHSPTLSRHATEAGIILGTAAYMSPEQARGKTIDKRADIWSFGVVMFEMLSGRRLFQGETASDTLAAVLRQDVDWSLLPKDLPASDRRLIERCLERDPKKRLRDIGEARLALDVAPESGRVAAAVPGRAGGKRGLFSMALIALIAFGAGVGVGSRLRAPESRSESGLKITPVTASGNVISASISPDGRYVAYVESDQGRQGLWLKQVASGQTLRLVPDETVAYWGHTFSPDGNSIIFGQKSASDTNGSLFSISTLGGTPKRLLSDMDSQVSFSPDGQRFAYTRLQHPTPEETSLMIASADGSNPTVLASFKLPEYIAGIFFGAPAWSPDGKTIVTAVGRVGKPGAETRARLVRLAVDGGAVSTLADPGWVIAAQAAWLPDGRSLLAIARSPDQDQAQLWSVSFPEGKVAPVTADLNDHRIVSLTHDGRTLVSVAGQLSSSVWTLPLKGPGKLTRVSRSTADGVNGLAFTLAGKVAYSSYVGGIWSLWIAAADGSERNSFLTLSRGESILSPNFTDDGSLYHLVRTRSGTEIRATTKDGSTTRVVTGDVNFDAVSVSQDGKTVVFTALIGGSDRVFSMPTAGGPRRQLADFPANQPVFHPSGKRAAFYFINAEGRFRLGVASVDGGPLLADLPTEVPSANSRLAFTDDGLYLNTMPGDRANVWLQPLDGRPARRITSFEDQILFDFAISRDGKTLAVARGPRLRDAQLITDFDASPAKEAR